ncbi:MAG: AMP-binding protein, partial [Muribaculaceae bacterium]
MLEKYLDKIEFESYDDFIENFKINVPDNFNFGYDIVDEWARIEPDKKALLWVNDRGDERQFTFADIKRESDKAASFFTSLGIGHGDMVMLILKRRYQFWIAITALHKIGATVIPATHLLTEKDIIYRCNAATIKAIVAVGDPIVVDHILKAKAKSPSVEHYISIGPIVPDGWHDFNRGLEEAPQFVRPEHPNTNDDISLMYFTSGTTGEPKMV